MNKELILKYKAEFDYWLNGGKLQANFVYDQWVEAPKDIFSYNMVNFVLVIDDEYVEFRKALAEGKTIQIINKFNNEWMDLNIVAFSGPAEYYRIKPEEPKFKVGDWVKTIDGAVIKLDWVDKPGVLSNLYDYGIFGKDNCKLSYQNEVTNWQPQPGEWCWFWNKEGYPFIARFKEHGKVGLFCPENFSATEFCEPFIGTLPTILKAVV